MLQTCMSVNTVCGCVSVLRGLRCCVSLRRHTTWHVTCQMLLHYAPIRHAHAATQPNNPKPTARCRPAPEQAAAAAVAQPRMQAWPCYQLCSSHRSQGLGAAAPSCQGPHSNCSPACCPACLCLLILRGARGWLAHRPCVTCLGVPLCSGAGDGWFIMGDPA